MGAFARKIWDFFRRKFFKEPPEIKAIVDAKFGLTVIDIDGIPEPGRISRILEFLVKYRTNLIVSILAGLIVALILYLFSFI